jgi:hypothetical protein
LKQTSLALQPTEGAWAKMLGLFWDQVVGNELEKTVCKGSTNFFELI